MSYQKFSGVVIGGPLDRQVMAHRDSRAFIEDRSAIDRLIPYGPSDLPSIEDKITAFGYMHVPFHRYDGAHHHEVGFWIPSDTKSDPVLHVLNVLAESYCADAAKVERRKVIAYVQKMAAQGMPMQYLAEFLKAGEHDR